MAKTKKALTLDALKKACENAAGKIFETKETIGVEDKTVPLHASMSWDEDDRFIHVSLLILCEDLTKLGYKEIDEDVVVTMFNLSIRVPADGIEMVKSAKDLNVYVGEVIKSKNRLWRNEDDETIMLSDVDNYLREMGIDPIR